MGFSDNAGVTDGKAARQAILEKANVILTGLLNNLASNYTTSNAFTIFAVQLKALAFEAARVISISEDVYNDLIFTTTRPQFISQNIESFLFYNERFSHFDQTDVQVRSFLLALIQAYFNGATAASIQNALTFEFSQEGQISFTLTEPIYEEYINPQLPAPQIVDFVRLQHQFTVAIEVGNSVIDVVTLQNDVEFVVNLIKPAHTELQVQFIFTEPQENSDSLGRINCILIYDQYGNPVIDQYGFQVTQKLGPRSICDVFNMAIFEYGYEDLRFDCLAMTQLEAVGEVATVVNPTTLKTRYGPISDGNGNLISNVDQLTVTVNGSPVSVLSVNALTGIITLAAPIPAGATVLITYFWLRRYYDIMTLNNPYALLNQFDPYDDSIPTFRYSTILWSPSQTPLPNVDPITCQYVYSGFDALDSSLLNDPSTLVYNRVSSRDKLNDYSVWQSTDYASGDTVTLNEGQSLFIYRQELTQEIQNTAVSAFIMNDPLSLLNSLVSYILGTTTINQITPDFVQKVYASIDVVSTCTEGASDRLKPMCEGGLSIFFGAANGTGGPFSDTYAGIQNEPANYMLITNMSGSVINFNPLYNPTGTNSTQFVMDLDWYPDSLTDSVTSGVTGEVYSSFAEVSTSAAMSIFEVDYEAYPSGGYFLLNSTGYVLGVTGNVLPPSPNWIIEDDLIEFGPVYSFSDTFLTSGFCLNDERSLLNQPTNPYGILRDQPGGCNSYISENLVEFLISGAFVEPYFHGAFTMYPMFYARFSPFQEYFVGVTGSSGFSPEIPLLLQHKAITPKDVKASLAGGFNEKLVFDDTYDALKDELSPPMEVSPLLVTNFEPINEMLSDITFESTSGF